MNPFAEYWMDTLMHRLASLLLTLAACASMTACAELAAFLPAPPPPTTARVIGIYVQHAPGVMIERSGSSIETDLPLYAEVRTTPRDGTPARTALVPLDGVSAGPGDTVEVALGERGTGFIAGARAASSRVVRVQAHAERTLVQRQLP